DQFLAQLTDEQKRYVFVKLSGPILGPIKEKRAVCDENDRWLGDYIPIPRPQPGQRLGMSDEAREALAKMPRFSLEEARALRAKLDAERRAAQAKGNANPPVGSGD